MDDTRFKPVQNCKLPECVFCGHSFLYSGEPRNFFRVDGDPGLIVCDKCRHEVAEESPEDVGLGDRQCDICGDDLPSGFKSTICWACIEYGSESPHGD